MYCSFISLLQKSYLLKRLPSEIYTVRWVSSGINRFVFLKRPLFALQIFKTINFHLVIYLYNTASLAGLICNVVLQERNTYRLIPLATHIRYRRPAPFRIYFWHKKISSLIFPRKKFRYFVELWQNACHTFVFLLSLKPFLPVLIALQSARVFS